ncbi:hypothetical protein Lser_V15G19718 [Lactuca serriola]
MSGSENNDLPKSYETSFPNEDDFLSLAHGNHTSLPPPPLIVLPDPQAQRLEKFKVTQAILAMKHEDGRPVWTHVLGMKSHIDRLRILGVIVQRKLAIDRVLQSFLESYKMIWRNSHVNIGGRSTSQTSMDMDNGNIGSPEKLSLPNGNGSALVNPVDRKSLCFHCEGKGHWKRNCPSYLKDLEEKKNQKVNSGSGIKQRKGNLKEEYVESDHEDGFLLHA